MKTELNFAKTLARDAGKIMLEHFSIGTPYSKKSDNSPVTIADTSINDLVIARIEETFPEHKVKGEESSDDIGSSEYTWVCDPIDGTLSYTNGLPTNMFSLALVTGGQPVLAVTYDPYLDRLFSAVKNEGAMLNGEPIHVNDIDLLSDARIGVSGPPENAFVDFIGLRTKLMQEKVSLQILTCTVYEAMIVAAGRFAGAISTVEHAHDVAAVKLIVEEAGGKVTDLYGESQGYVGAIEGVIISNGVLHDSFQELVNPYLKSRD